MTRQDTNLGFSIVEALLILVVIGILGFTGWYVYHVRQTADKNHSAAANATVPTYKKKIDTKAKTAAPPVPQGTYLDFKEVRVKMLLSSSISDAVYAPVNNSLSTDGAVAVFGLSTRSIEDAGSNCDASNGPLGLVRVTATAPMRLVPPNGEAPMAPDNKTLFLIGSKYYQYIAPQDFVECGTVSTAQFEANQQAFEQSFASLQSDSAAQ